LLDKEIHPAPGYEVEKLSISPVRPAIYPNASGIDDENLRFYSVEHDVPEDSRQGKWLVHQWQCR
jgi:hypothetical protein